MKKLISMTDFVLSQRVRGMEVQGLGHQYIERARRFYLIQRYAEFLRQPLTLGMFVPCDEYGNVLEEPYQWHGALEFAVGEDYDNSYKYQQAKERVLFEGFELSKGNLIKHNWCKIFFLKHKNGYTYFELTDFTKEELPVIEIKTIEDLTIVFNLALTPQSIKQIGL